MSMLTKKEIANAYRRTKARKIALENDLVQYKRLYELRTKMETLSDRYPELMWNDCPERKGKSVPLAFCMEKCVHKCGDFQFVLKHNPKFIAVVNRLNTAFSKLLNQIEKRAD